MTTQNDQNPFQFPKDKDGNEKPIFQKTVSKNIRDKAAKDWADR